MLEYQTWQQTIKKMGDFSTAIDSFKKEHPNASIVSHAVVAKRVEQCAYEVTVIYMDKD